ncbi:TPA: hypothetical protein ACH3X3_000845 [Trebouxia sp. C0006]
MKLLGKRSKKGLQGSKDLLGRGSCKNSKRDSRRCSSTSSHKVTGFHIWKQRPRSTPRLTSFKIRLPTSVAFRQKAPSTVYAKLFLHSSQLYLAAWCSKNPMAANLASQQGNKWCNSLNGKLWTQPGSLTVARHTTSRTMSDLLMISSGADLDWQVACLLKWWRYDSARTTQFKCNMQCTPSMSCMLCCCRLTTGGRCAATTTPWLNMAMMLRAQPSALLMLRIPWEVLAGTCRCCLTWPSPHSGCSEAMHPVSAPPCCTLACCLPPLPGMLRTTTCTASTTSI